MKKYFAAVAVFIFASFSLNPVFAADLSPVGPGGRLHGADISRWQHPNDKLINFQKR